MIFLRRVNVITAAYSLIGEVGYFWGGKSTVIGKDSSWGTAEKVSVGSPSTELPEHMDWTAVALLHGL